MWREVASHHLPLLCCAVIAGIFVILAVGSIMLYTLAQQWADNEDKKTSEVRTLQALSIIGFVLTALYVCLLCVMRKRIQLALGIVKESARALAAMPVLVFMPVIQAAGIVVFLVPWTIYAVYLASSGDIKVHETTDVGGDETQYKTMEYDKNTRLAFLYLLFCWFWTSEFILAVGQIVSGMSVAAWYFTRDKKAEGNRTVFWVSHEVHESTSLQKRK